MSGYAEFLATRAFTAPETGIPATVPLNPALYGFQEEITRWALRKGRAAIFADCGLGKTLMQLAWADAIAKHTNRPTLILTPLAVAPQTVREGRHFGIEAERISYGTAPHIGVTNYQKLHHFDPSEWGAIVLDESSILKSFNGATRKTITVFMHRIPYRLLCTATAAPNDHTELGTSSEALGHMGHIDMLTRFFRSDNGTVDSRAGGRTRFGTRKGYRFKGHAEIPFWRWVASWALAIRKPSDMGHPDNRFVLPSLRERKHIVTPRTLAEGTLFPMVATNFHEERAERRRTIQERCERVAELVEGHDCSIIWCHLNDEGNLLAGLIPDAVQVAGADPDERKEAALTAFAEGKIRRLITKPSIGAWGLNLQRCAHVVTFASHSYEQYYQSVRRCWRFGQTRPVIVDQVLSEGEVNVMANLERKARAATRMFDALVTEMHNAAGIDSTRQFTQFVQVPPWLTTN